MPLPPPSALPVVPVRAAVGHAGCGSHHDQCFVRRRSRMDCGDERPKKLALDFMQRVGLLGVMDEDTLELIIRLGTRVGMIMEEANPVALMMTGLSEAQVRAAIAALAKASDEIAALVAAMNKLAGK